MLLLYVFKKILSPNLRKEKGFTLFLKFEHQITNHNKLLHPIIEFQLICNS